MSFQIDFLVTDINGQPITGLTEFDFNIIAQVNQTDISPQASVLESSAGNGFYTVTIDPLPVGQGTIQLQYIGVGYGGYPYFVTPHFEYLRRESASTLDDVYGLVFSNSVVPVAIDRTSRFATINITVKEGDDFVEQIQVPTRYLPLTGWTDFSIQLYNSSRLNNPSAPALGDGTVTIIDPVQGILEVEIPRAITEFTVPAGVSSTSLYSDIQALDSDGKLRTVYEIVWTVRREFNTDLQIGYGP